MLGENSLEIVGLPRSFQHDLLTTKGQLIHHILAHHPLCFLWKKFTIALLLRMSLQQ